MGGCVGYLWIVQRRLPWGLERRTELKVEICRVMSCKSEGEEHLPEPEPDGKGPVEERGSRLWVEREAGDGGARTAKNG